MRQSPWLLEPLVRRDVAPRGVARRGVARRDEALGVLVRRPLTCCLMLPHRQLSPLTFSLPDDQQYQKALKE